MSASASDNKPADQPSSTAAAIPKRITNAQTVCSEKNEKGKLCNGHLKQLRTAGEPSEIHLRGDDVLFKCQTCGTLYMGPPLGHVRDPFKQTRFVEAELSALLQAAGGTLPVIKKDDRGVFVIAEGGSEHSHAKPAAAKPAPAEAAPKPATAPTPKPAATAPAPTPKPEAAEKPAAPIAAAPEPPKPAEHKAGAQPNRELFKRSTYAGVADTGPVPGETFEQKVARLKELATAAKQRADEGGVTTAAPVVQNEPAAVPVPIPPPASAPPPAPVVQASTPAPAAHKPTGNADRSLMKRSTYCGVVDTGPVPGETFQQKVARLTALAAAAKQRSEEGGA